MQTATVDDDDYMSDNLLAMVADVRPGIVHGALARKLKIEREQDEAREKQAEASSARKNIEITNRTEALAKPVSHESKGFALLSKMGYKPGMNIGARQRDDALKVPIPLEIKGERTGLGLETERKRKAEESFEKHLEMTKRRQKYHHQILGDYRARKRDANTQRQTTYDLQNAQKVCRELDMRLDDQAAQVPVCSWYWPPTSIKQSALEELGAGPDCIASLTNSELLESEPDPPPLPSHSNKKPNFPLELDQSGTDQDPGPAADNDDECDWIEPSEKLTRIATYLRATHLYCVWCSTQYTDDNDMQQHCPGSAKHDHDDDTDCTD